jgi:hypothetical protein
MASLALPSGLSGDCAKEIHSHHICLFCVLMFFQVYFTKQREETKSMASKWRDQRRNCLIFSLLMIAYSSLELTVMKQQRFSPFYKSINKLQAK